VDAVTDQVWRELLQRISECDVRGVLPALQPRTGDLSPRFRLHHPDNIQESGAGLEPVLPRYYRHIATGAPARLCVAGVCYQDTLCGVLTLGSRRME